MWATCPLSASSGYQVEFHKSCYQKHTNPLNCNTSCLDISGCHADFHEGHGTVGEWQGCGVCELTGTAWVWHDVWISLKSAVVNRQYTSVTYFRLLLLQLEKLYVVNARGAFRIKFIVCDWILLTKENMASDPKIKVDKLVGKTKWPKRKWQINIQFEQCDMMSIIDGTRKCPNITNTEKASEDDQ
jgi:hypothetical protein